MLGANYTLFEKFITTQECTTLADWILDFKNTNLFKNSGHPGTIRKTTRRSTNIVYPDTAYDIQKRIDKLIQSLFDLGTLVRVPSFVDGMYGSYGTTGDSCLVHKDPRWLPNFVTYHFNIILSTYENAELYIDKNLVKMNITDAVLYPVSEVPHYTTKLTGTDPRLFWCFGYCIPLHKTSFQL